jgi:monofunctional biosynthetic peptidoglycan transglycosylase
MIETLPHQGSEAVLAGTAPTGRRQGKAARFGASVLPCLRITLVAGTRVLILASLLAVAMASAFFSVFRFANPPTSALMLARQISGQHIDRRWVPLGSISPNLVRAVIMAEDGQFCRHRGIDLEAFEAALERAERTGDDSARGASTISMQVSKNLLLWPARSYLRKGLEFAITIVMELIWPKRRILEVYLNIAEWGPGIFGAEAAARYHYRKPASRLTMREAALLAAALPNPIERVAGRPGPGTQRLATLIESRARGIGTRAACALTK